MNGGRTTALGLLIAIVAAEILLSGRASRIWSALWGPVVPLGQGFHGLSGLGSGATKTTSTTGGGSGSGAATAASAAAGVLL